MFLSTGGVDPTWTYNVIGPVYVFKNVPVPCFGDGLDPTPGIHAASAAIQQEATKVGGDGVLFVRFDFHSATLCFGARSMAVVATGTAIKLGRRSE